MSFFLNLEANFATSAQLENDFFVKRLKRQVLSLKALTESVTHFGVRLPRHATSVGSGIWNCDFSKMQIARHALLI